MVKAFISSLSLWFIATLALVSASEAFENFEALALVETTGKCLLYEVIVLYSSYI